ncbi:adenylate/guanylate cyclase domain-containing protein [Mesorhizobium sp. LHD-90]|uniref:adenylate/guanylate cyclase domain-containing protein n=1 Tax=Mesorhizobium sp. LHD-90 TaxID=3071414 RepID=UPI0027E08148|nr:adenylate/guanylate cyclase domain-containing protein [Mesorhizobium sp. LHD-90]MDQ6435034.1 adenylate/guanylate cyclase domain-containing protein [Mesorhizobium sp. LHD-90]
MRRHLAAILAADVAGYSRLMGEDEEGTVKALHDQHAIMFPMIRADGGRVINTAGDSILAEFDSVVGAVRCAVGMQKLLAEQNAIIPDSRRLAFRMGITQGEIVVDEDDVYGEGINVAARLQALAEVDGIAISGRVHEDVAGKLDVEWREAGEQTLKNIARPVRVWRWSATQAQSPPRAMPVVSDRPSIAVLPFDNLSGQAEETVFSDGVTEDIITGLTHYRSLFVIARNSSFSFRGKPTSLVEIGRQLGVSHLLEGSIRRSGDRIRITAQLIEAATGAHIWAERYDRSLTDIFAVQDELARTIVSTLVGRIQDARLQRSLRVPTTSLDAYDCLLRGLAHYRGFAGDDNRKAQEMFARAVELDPYFALAHANLAMTHTALYGHTAAPPEIIDEAFVMASRALELDPQESHCHRVIGTMWLFRRQYHAAEQHFRRAVELNPNDADRRMGLGYLLVLRGKIDEGLERMQEAGRLNPFPPVWYHARFGVVYYSLGRFAEAAQEFSEIPTPGYWLRARLAACDAQLGHATEVEALKAAILEERPDFSIAEFFRKDILLERAEDRELLREGLIKAGLPE